MIGKTRKDKKEKGKEKGGKSSSREHKPVPSPRDDVLAAVAALRAKVEEEGLKVDYEIHDEWRLAGFVKGAGLDVDKAFLNFTHSLKMRAECGADTVLETAPKTNKNFPLVLKYWPGHYHKHDKDGCPVYYERLGAVDVRGLLNTVPGEDLFNVHVYQQEQSRALKAQLSKEHNRSMYLCIFVQDLSGLSMNHLYTPAFDLFKKILGFDQSNYPDSLKSYYVINSPACLKMMYSLIKPLLDPNTRKKVHILGSNYRDTLLEVIDEEHLPAEYGGECACEGGCIPGGGKFVDLKDDGTTYNPAEVSIGRKDKHEVKLTVAQGATLSWEFTVKSHDVGFGVFFGEGKEREALVAIEKHHGTRKGKLTAEKAGTYWLVWDNTYSILKGKSVEYQAFINADTDDDDDDDDESSGEDREGDSESSGSGDEGDFDEDSDEDHGEEPEAEGKEEVDDEGEETERYWYTDDEEDEQQEEERRAEGARVEPESAKEERRRRAGGAPDVAEATKASTTSSQPRKPAFLLSPAQRRENWEAKYALVKAWFDEHGRLPSKAKSKTLHNWLHYNKKSWSPLDPSQRNRLRALGVKPFRRRRCKETPSPSSRAKEEVEPEPLRDGLPKRRVRTGGDTAIWEGQLRKLERFRAATDGQNPPYFLSTGKWLYEQIALQNRGLLSSSRKSRLESLGIKWDWKDEFANKSGCEKAKKWKQRAERTQDSSDTEEKKGSAKTKERENERREGKEKKRETKKKAKKEKTTIKKRRAEEEKAKKNNPKKRLKREVKEKEGHTKVPWEVRYEELCQYLAAHDQHLPGKQTTLGKWVYTQQYRINKGLQAQEDKIAKLVALGITLSPPKTPTTPTTTTTTTTTTTPTTISAAALPEPEQKHLQDHGGATEEDERKVSATMEELLQRIKEEKL